jgi:O-antigen/teichoic acid export membrane protein
VPHADEHALIRALGSLRTQHVSGGIPLNLAGREWAIREFDQDRRLAYLLDVLLEREPAACESEGGTRGTDRPASDDTIYAETHAAPAAPGPSKVRLGSASAYSLIAQMFRLAVGFVASVLIANTLGVEAKGVLTETLQVPAVLMAVLNLGIASANTYFVGTRKHGVSEVLGNSLAVAGVLGVIGIPAVLLFTVGSLKVVEGIPLAAAFLACAILPATLANQFVTGINTGLGEMKALARTQMAGTIISIAVIGGTYLLGELTVATATAATLLSAILSLALNTRRLMGRYAKHLSVKLSALRESASYSGKAYLSNVTGYLSYRQDIIVLGYLDGVGPVGIYSIAVTFAELMWYAPNALAGSLLSKNLQSETADADALTLLSSRVIAAFMLLICIVAGLLIRPIIALFFPAFGLAFVPFLLLLPGIWMIGIARVLSANLASRGLLYPWVSFCAMVANLALNVMLIPLFGGLLPHLSGGAIGAALSSTLSYSASSIATMWLFARATKTRPSQWLFLTRADRISLLAAARSYMSVIRRRLGLRSRR